jgi:hypothetical protein
MLQKNALNAAPSLAEHLKFKPSESKTFLSRLFNGFSRARNYLEDIAYGTSVDPM